MLLLPLSPSDLLMCFSKLSASSSNLYFYSSCTKLLIVSSFWLEFSSTIRVGCRFGGMDLIHGFWWAGAIGKVLKIFSYLNNVICTWEISTVFFCLSTDYLFSHRGTACSFGPVCFCDFSHRHSGIAEPLNTQ